MYNTDIQESQVKRNPTKWGWLFIILGIVQILLIALLVSVYLYALELYHDGKAGSEIIVLAVFMRAVPILGLVSLINVIGLPIYMLAQKPRGKTRIFNTLSLVISGMLVVYVAYAFARYA